MTSKTPRVSVAENPAPSKGAGFFVGVGRVRRTAGRVIRIIFPQWLKTLLVTLVWLGLMSPWVSVTTLYTRTGNGAMVGIGMAVSTAIACHVWPTRTPPWRTVAFTAFFSAWLGSTLLLAGFLGYGLTVTHIVCALFVLARVNQNGRKVYRALMRRPLATKV